MARQGRPPIDPAWKQYAFSQFENEPRLSIAKLYVKVTEKAERDGRQDYPSERTLTRWRKEFAGLPEEARTAYRLVFYPETFLQGLLPWESAARIIELLQAVPRPSLQIGRWYWRVTLAAPKLPVETRHVLAANLAHAERWGDALVPRAAEALLVYAPWRSRESAHAYRQAVEDGRVPAPPVLKLEYLEDVDRLRRATPEERTQMLEATERAVAEMERARKEAEDAQG